MPLSEEEQRILGEIEANLLATDPDLARQVGSTTVYSDALRKLKWGLTALFAALVLTVFLLTVSHLAAFVGFLGMVAAAIFVESNARRLGRAGMNEATQALRGGGLKGYFNDVGSKAKDRLRRPDDDS